MNREDCILASEYEPCNNCGECLVCDLNTNKECDNCMECIDMPGYNAIEVTGVDYDKEEGLELGK